MDPFFTASISLRHTNVSGGLDSIFCQPGSRVHRLEADCGGDEPKVTCSCCTTCCTESTCETDQLQICKNTASDFEFNRLEGRSSCVCDTSGRGFSCAFDDDCETCNEDSTVCGVTRSSEFSFAEHDVVVSHTTSFQYTTEGRNTSVVVGWEDFLNNTCNVYVNGMKCRDCARGKVCTDGTLAMAINCRNVLNFTNDGPVSYDSCFPPPLEDGGVLEIFEWMDTDSWTGCPLIPLQGESRLYAL